MIPKTKDGRPIHTLRKDTAYLNPEEIAQRHPTSLRKAINGKCWDCSGQNKAEVSRCTVYGCSLWPVRPWQKGERNGA